MESFYSQQTLHPARLRLRAGLIVVVVVVVISRSSTVEGSSRGDIQPPTPTKRGATRLPSKV